MLIGSKCVDYGSDWCPCILAETGHCPVCSQAAGADACDCNASGGVCIREELLRNGGKARPPRPTIRAEVADVRAFGTSVFLRIRVPHELELALRRPGSFVFVRKDESPFFDIPLSVQYAEVSNGTIAVSIIPRGAKSDQMRDVRPGDSLFVRGPYFSGLVGLRDLQTQTGGKCLVLTKGIGLLPSIAVIRQLAVQGNEVRVLADAADFSDKLLAFNLDLFEIKAEQCHLTEPEGLSDEAMGRIREALDSGVRLIHVGASDWVIGKVSEFLRAEGRTDVKLICCNNARMCCGEGICGACTATTSSRKTVHFCKEQPNAWEIRA